MVLQEHHCQTQSWSLPCPGELQIPSGLPLSLHTPSSPQPWELPAAALKGNRLHLPREKDPDHRVENFWIHVV